jgi:hypothetical protein
MGHPLPGNSDILFVLRGVDRGDFFGSDSAAKHQNTYFECVSKPIVESMTDARGQVRLALMLVDGLEPSTFGEFQGESIQFQSHLRRIWHT